MTVFYNPNYRHMQQAALKPPLRHYTPKTRHEFSQAPGQVNREDEARLQVLRGLGNWTQADAEEFDEVTTRMEQAEETRNDCLRRELEGYFNGPGVAPLPPPLPKSSHWLETCRACHYRVPEVRPFMVACEEGSTEVIRSWVGDPAKKASLRPIGLQDGLACAARGNHVDAVRYMLDEAGARLSGAVVEAACRHQSVALFELAFRHGYHPDQQIPSKNGHFGVALNHCIENHNVVKLLLAHGADVNLAPFQDSRRCCWTDRSTPPMDRRCGLALDLAAERGSVEVVFLLLEHGANPRYSRPLHGILERGKRGDLTEGECISLMGRLLDRGAEINGNTWKRGTPVLCAVSKQMWEAAGFLLNRGADPFWKSWVLGCDSFALAAKRTETPWEMTPELEAYLQYLAQPTTSPHESTAQGPAGAKENILVRVLDARKSGESERLVEG